MNINIKDNICWRCGEEKTLTKHHVLPKHLKPVKNVLVPLCKECHDEVTAEDTTGLYAYIIKLEHSVKSLANQIKGLRTVVENKALIKVKKK